MSKRFPTHFDCTLTEVDKRKFTPWLLEKCLTNCLGTKPVSIRSTSKHTFTIEVNSKQQASCINSLRDINGIPVKISVNSKLNVNKGLIYIYNYSMCDFQSFKEGLMKQHGLQDVIEPHWIRPRQNNKAKPLLLNFPGEMPQYIQIPGEQAMTRVIEYKQRPLICRKCQEYGHSKNNCRDEVRCGNCSERDHTSEECTNPKKCHHCKEQHQAGNRECKEYRYQEEISAVQAKEKVTRNQAKAIFDRRNPAYKTMNYSRAAQQSQAVKPQQLKHQEAEKETQNVPQIQKTEIVCMSPQSGTLFTTTVEIPDNIANNSNKKKQQIVDTIDISSNSNHNTTIEMEDEVGNEDRESFQRELQAAKRASPDANKAQREGRERSRASPQQQREKRRKRTHSVSGRRSQSATERKCTYEDRSKQRRT